MSDIAHSAAEFSRQLDQLSVYIEGDVAAVIRKACLDLYRRIVERTPVDTGRAKASWGISTTGNNDVKEYSGWSNNEIIRIINKNISDFDFSIEDETVYIVNNTEYISHLESGSSQHAPSGMVAISLTEFSDHFRKALSTLTDNYLEPL